MTAVEALGGVAAGYVLTGVMKPSTATTATTATDTGAGAGAGTNAAATTGVAAKSGWGTSNVNLGACIAAATSAYSAYSKNADEKTSEQTVQQNVASLQSLESNVLNANSAVDGSAAWRSEAAPAVKPRRRAEALPERL